MIKQIKHADDNLSSEERYKASVRRAVKAFKERHKLSNLGIPRDTLNRLTDLKKKMKIRNNSETIVFLLDFYEENGPDANKA